MIESMVTKMIESTMIEDATNVIILSFFSNLLLLLLLNLNVKLLTCYCSVLDPQFGTFCEMNRSIMPLPIPMIMMFSFFLYKNCSTLTNY